MSKRRRGFSGYRPKAGSPKAGNSGAARIPSRSPTQTATVRRVRRSRRVVRRIDTGSVFKFSVFFYLTLACILFVAGVALWLVATAVGVRENVERFIGDLIASNTFHFVGWEVLKVFAVGAVLLVILGTAFNLFLAVIYNLISEIVGGMALIVDDEHVVTTPAPATAPRAAPPLLPASERADIFANRRPAAGDAPSSVAEGAKPAAAIPPTWPSTGPSPSPPPPVTEGEGPRSIARWIPKRGPEV
jgi:hypothetical protein